MSQTLYSRFGGAGAVGRLVFDFYDRVLASPRLAPYFASVDMARLVEHQARFIASVMGGPASFSDAHLREVHAHLGVDGPTFDEMAGLLCASLRDAGLDPADVDLVMAAIHRRRPLIVTRDPG